MKLYVFGNRDYKPDSLAFEVADKLVGTCHGMSLQIIEVKPNEDLPFVDEKKVVILDTVAGIDEVKLNSLEQNSPFKRGGPTAGVCWSESHSNSKQTYKLIQNSQIIPFDPQFTPNLKVNQQVAVHWNLVSKILTAKETKRLSYWTKKLINNL